MTIILFVYKIYFNIINVQKKRGSLIQYIYTYHTSFFTSLISLYLLFKKVRKFYPHSVMFLATIGNNTLLNHGLIFTSVCTIEWRQQPGLPSVRLPMRLIPKRESERVQLLMGCSSLGQEVIQRQMSSLSVDLKQIFLSMNSRWLVFAMDLLTILHTIVLSVLNSLNSSFISIDLSHSYRQSISDFLISSGSSISGK